MQTTLSEVSRIGAAFTHGRPALIPYIPAGFPDRAGTSDILESLVSAGADVIELGIPFSDPLADGPTIQRASHTALAGGATVSWTLGALARFRARHATPVVLFSYLNPILSYGVERFLNDATTAGADGLLLTDLPLGSDPELERALEESPLDLVRLIAPTTQRERAREIAARSQGFVYYVSRTGVTGAVQTLRSDLAREVADLRAATSVPVAVGFGISSGLQAREMAAVADGVVVGSALIDALERGGIAGMGKLLQELRAALAG